LDQMRTDIREDSMQNNKHTGFNVKEYAQNPTYVPHQPSLHEDSHQKHFVPVIIIFVLTKKCSKFINTWFCKIFFTEHLFHCITVGIWYIRSIILRQPFCNIKTVQQTSFL